MDARSFRICRYLLLIALTIQGFTPDLRNLSSRWLIQVLTRRPAGQGSSPLPVDDQHESPHQVCAPARMDAASRTRFDSNARPCGPYMVVGPCDRLIPTDPVALHLFGTATRASHDLIRSLCRYLF